MIKTMGMEDMVKNLEHKQLQDNQRNTKERPDELPEEEEQLHYHRQKVDTSSTKAARDLIHIDTKPINPHTDIQPPGKATIEVRTVPIWTKEKVTEDTRACCYNPRGECVATMKTILMAQLKGMYQPEAARPMTFEEEILMLLARNKDGAGTDVGVKQKMSNHCSIPPKVMAVIRGTFRTTKERFASPLNRN
jgi:hypothetical protein